jgi:hypothetical protein
LLGDFQNFQEIGDAQAWVAVNEVKDAVVASTETVLFEHRIRLGGEVTIGEEEEFGISDELFGMT